MTELPKSVREQLARAQSGTQHPDADLLTGYSENTLTAAERQSVTEHLASCSECREVIFLAQPETAAAQVVVAPARPKRLNWMAWASVAAVIVVVGSAVVLRRNEIQRVDEPKLVATEQKAAPPAETRNRAGADLAAAPTQSAKSTSADRIIAAKPAPAVPLPMQDAKKEMDEVAAKQERVEQIVAPRDNETNQAGLNSAGVVAGRVAESGPSNAANVSNVYTANNNAAPAAAVAKKQKLDAAPRQEIGSESLGYVQAAPAAAPAARAHWRISTDGKVERSYGSDAWSPVLTDTGASFQVVSVVGNVVWAGGSHGALYASRDGGTNWIPIKIATTADITSIHFDDELHGVLRTSDGKTWKSMDGGNTWSLQ